VRDLEIKEMSLEEKYDRLLETTYWLTLRVMFCIKNWE